MIGWLIALAIIVLLAVLPLGVSVIYDTGGPLVRWMLGPFRGNLYPKEKKEKPEKQNKEKTKKTSKSKTKKKTAKKEKKGGNISDFFPLVDLLLDFLADFFSRKLRVKRLELDLVLAGDDPCDLAVNYGRAWAALGNLIPVLERFLVINKRDMQVRCDFEADKTLVYARADLTITIGRLLAVSLRHGIRILSEFLKITKLRKGGAVK